MPSSRLACAIQHSGCKLNGRVFRVNYPSGLLPLAVLVQVVRVDHRPGHVSVAPVRNQHGMSIFPSERRTSARFSWHQLLAVVTVVARSALAQVAPLLHIKLQASPPASCLPRPTPAVR